MRKLYVKCELCSLWANPVIIGGYRELAAQATDRILIQMPCQFENDGATPFIIGQIPNTLTQNGIYHRSNLILSAPDGIKSIIVFNLQFFADIEIIMESIIVLIDNTKATISRGNF